MKHFLRNLTLASVLAVSATAFADDATPTVSLKWSQTTTITSGYCRFGTGFDSKVYYKDYKNAKVMCLDGSNESTYASNSGGGTAITSDDAGNIISNNTFPSKSDVLNWTIIQPNGTISTFAVTLPSDISAGGRTDQVGGCVGDVMSDEGGFFFAACSDQSKILMIYVRNGQQDNTKYSSYLTKSTLPAANTTGTCVQPRYSFEETKAKLDAGATVDDVILIRTNTTKSIYYYTDSKWATYTAPSGANTQNGYDVFELNGTTYQVMPVKVSNNWENYFVIADSKGNIVYQSKTDIPTDWSPSHTGTVTFGSFKARKVSEKKVELYQYYSSSAVAGAAMWEITIPEYNLYFENTSGWEKVYAYIWDSNENKVAGEWPGTKLSTTSIDGKDYFVYHYDGNLADMSVIFNNGGNGSQTNTYSVVNNQLYNASEATGSSLEMDGEYHKNLYAAGTFQSWAPASATEFEYADGIYTLNIDNASKGDGFKISTVRADWNSGFNGSVLGISDSATTLELDKTYSLIEDKTGNLELPSAGSFTVTVDLANKTLVLSSEDAEEETSKEVYLRGDQFGWDSFDDENKFTYIGKNDSGEDVYQLSLDDLEGEFKIAEETWNQTIDYGTGCNVMIGGQDIYYGGGNCYIPLMYDVTLTLYVKGDKAQSWLDIQGEASCYMIYADQDYTTELDSNDDNTFDLEIEEVKKGDSFQISGGRYAPIMKDTKDAFDKGVYGVSDEDITIEKDKVYDIVGGKSGKFIFPASGDYKIYVDLVKRTMKLECTREEEEEVEEEAPELYVRGDMNSWGADADNKMTLESEKSENGEFVYTYAISGVKGQLKIADADWTNDYNFGATEKNVSEIDVDGQTVKAEILNGNNGGNTYYAWKKSDQNFYIDVTNGSATLTFYYLKGRDNQWLKVEGNTTGVENVMADQLSDVRYYNLNGVSVNADNLTNGVYIRVANGKAQKVLVK